MKADYLIVLLRDNLMKFSLMENFVNIMLKNIYYIVGKDEKSYHIRPLIYDAKFKPEEETT